MRPNISSQGLQTKASGPAPLPFRPVPAAPIRPLTWGAIPLRPGPRVPKVGAIATRPGIKAPVPASRPRFALPLGMIDKTPGVFTSTAVPPGAVDPTSGADAPSGTLPPDNPNDVPPEVGEKLGTRSDRKKDNWKECFRLKVDVIASLTPQGIPLFFPAWGWGGEGRWDGGQGNRHNQGLRRSGTVTMR